MTAVARFHHHHFTNPFSSFPSRARIIRRLSHSSVNRDEIARFNQQAQDWWQPDGSGALLLRMNSCRIAFIQRCIHRHQWKPEKERNESPGVKNGVHLPLDGQRILDVGCGAGLLCEPLARLGAQVVGIDAASESIRFAKTRQQAFSSGFDDHRPVSSISLVSSIEYVKASIETLEMKNNTKAHGFGRGLTSFDLVTAMEVIEHVEQPRRFLAHLTRRIRHGGLLIVSTLDRSLASYLLAIIMAERLLGLVPKNTHDWRRFIQPEELCDALLHLDVDDETSNEHPPDYRMEIMEVSGMVPDMCTGGFRLDASRTDVNYLLAARRVDVR